MKTSSLLLGLFWVSFLSAIAEVKEEPGRQVLESLEATNLKVVDFHNVTFQEGMMFVGMRLRQLQQPPPTGGTSIIYNVAQKPGGDDEFEEPPNPDFVFETYSARDKSVLEIITDLCRMAGVDAHVTSVGIVLSPAGTPPFPNPKAIKGEVWRTLVENRREP